jgi:uncharacterized protein (TIGR00369 family)
MSSVESITAGRYQSSFESFLGVQFLEYGQGKCRIELKIKPEFLNIAGAVHGGIINALCDIALSGAVTCNFVDKAETVVTMQMNVNFLRAGHAGDTLTAYAEVIKYGSTIVYVEGGVTNQDAKLIARAAGDWFIKK